MHRPAKPATVRIAVALCCAAVFFAFARPAAAQAGPGSAEKLLLDSANHERSARGLGLLQWDEALAWAARLHAQRMAEQGAIAHQFPGEPDLLGRAREFGARFLALAENVAEGPTAAGVHSQWMNSGPHRENLLNPQMNAMGAAVEQRGGLVFAVEDFSQTVADLSLAEQQNRLAARLKQRGLSIIADDGAALRLCEGQRASPAGTGRRGSFYLRFSTGDLGSLPDVIGRELDSGRYHGAAVAACQPADDEGFSVYQLGVVLLE